MAADGDATSASTDKALEKVERRRRSKHAAEYDGGRRHNRRQHRHKSTRAAGDRASSNNSVDEELSNSPPRGLGLLEALADQPAPFSEVKGQHSTAESNSRVALLRAELNAVRTHAKPVSTLDFSEKERDENRSKMVLEVDRPVASERKPPLQPSPMPPLQPSPISSKLVLEVDQPIGSERKPPLQPLPMPLQQTMLDEIEIMQDSDDDG